MTTTAPNANPRVINSPGQAPDWDAWGPEVEKIVIGPTPGAGGAESLEMAEVPPNLARRFPKLSHLYLWNIRGLASLPWLPDSIECVDLRGCVDLRQIRGLPKSLQTLVLDGCPGLNEIPPPGSRALPELEDLSVKGCHALSEDWIRAALNAAPALRLFDTSDCPQLEKIRDSWPEPLVRIELNGCAKLRVLPPRWPESLRRLGMRGAAMLMSLPELPASADYLDFADMGQLTALPSGAVRARTLYLYKSGVLMPPASEHGATPDENVATRTRAYFDDVELVGQGEVKRCKLLILGNGGSGKTTLALQLLGMDPVRDNPGSTHGVQFWDWSDFRAELEATVKGVDLHVWDFGGQEIYHNTHRLFMSKGAVFIVLWYPEQDGQRATRAPGGYQDEWRPLQYWLDLIELAAGRGARIAVVCSLRSDVSVNLEERRRAQLTANHQTRRCFYIDAIAGTGDLARLRDWLSEEVGRVVQTEGGAVPTHWEIAQGLVASWLPKSGTGALARHEMPQDAFQKELDAAIGRTIADDQEGRYRQLAAAVSDGRFVLTPDRVERTLGFLTRSGWVYWDAELFEKRVIIGQQWALDGIYAILDRRPASGIYDRLKRAGGQFTRLDLDEWVRRELGYNEGQQRLLISFMESVGVCFRLVSEEQSRWREPVFMTFEHLPSAGELDLEGRLSRAGAREERTVECARLHKGHWQGILKALGQQYGTDGKYAADGFFLANAEGQSILLTAQIESDGLGGHIRVKVAGPEAAERADALMSFVRGFLPDAPAAKAESGRLASGAGPAGSAPGNIHVFISYAWGPKGEEVPAVYQKPVDAICAALGGKPVEILRDCDVVKRGGSISAFMQRIKTTERVIIVHSDCYWRSACCMWEFGMLMSSFGNPRKAEWKDVLILVEHLQSGFKDRPIVETHMRFWEERQDMPTLLVNLVTLDRLRSSALHSLDHHITALAELKDLNRDWNEENAPEVIAWIKKLLGLPRPPAGGID